MTPNNWMTNITMRAMWILLVLLGTIPCKGSEPTDRIEFSLSPGQVTIRLGSQPLATYVYQDAAISRPYFKDIRTRDGIQVTRHQPPQEGVDPTDHATFHPGLWMAFGDLSGADSWRNQALVEHVEFIQAPRTVDNRGTFTVRNRYRDKDRTVCEEICQYAFLIRPSGCFIFWNSTFQSDQNDFAFGDQEEMGLGVRVATPIMVKSNLGGRILDNEGRKNEKGIWGKPAQWCDYSGWIDKSFVGITIMPDPGNFRPCRWHTRDYGFLAANPFGQSVFQAGPTDKTIVQKGQPFRLSFGILIHAAKKEDGINLPAAFRDYLTLSQQMKETAESERATTQCQSHINNPDSNPTAR